MVKGPRRFLAYSEHPSGADVLYVPRERILESCKDIQSCVFRILIVGYSQVAEFEMIFDIEREVRNIHPDDQAALESIYKECCQGDDACTAWSSAVDTPEDGEKENFCHLPGQICNNNGRITHLRLNHQSMSCDLPAALSKLTALERLFLFANDITGTFQQFLNMAKNMKNLNHVHMADMALTGSLTCCEPGSADCLSHLQTLDMKRNSLQGSLPQCLIDLPKIGVLDFRSNKLTGSLPSTIEPNKHMIVLDVRDQAGQGMTGQIPDLRPLENLALVGLSGNSFTGAFPALPPKLEAVHISGTSIQGGFHPSVNELQKIWVFEAANNDVTGPIPDMFWSSETLKLLDLSNNKLSGELPQTWASMNLRALRLQDNELTGQIPAGLAALNRLNVLNLTNNNFGGSLEAYSEALGFNTLGVFAVAHNDLTGPIPQNLQRLGSFAASSRMTSSSSQVFDVSYNRLDGDFPEHLIDTVVQLTHAMQGFSFSVQGNYLRCPSDEAKQTIIANLPAVAETTCMEGGNLLTIKNEDVPDSVKQLMKPEPEAATESQRPTQPQAELQPQPQTTVDEQVETQQVPENDVTNQIDQNLDSASPVTETVGDALQVQVTAQNSDVEAGEDSGMQKQMVIIISSVLGAVVFVALLVGTAIGIKKLLQRHRGEQYREYDPEASQDNPVLPSRAEAASDQEPPMPTMTETDYY